MRGQGWGFKYVSSSSFHRPGPLKIIQRISPPSCLVQLALILLIVVPWIGIMCITAVKPNVGKYLVLLNSLLRIFVLLPSCVPYMGWGVGWGSLISLFLDFSAPMLPAQNGLSRMQPDATKEIWVDTLLHRIAALRFSLPM